MVQLVAVVPVVAPVAVVVVQEVAPVAVVVVPLVEKVARLAASSLAHTTGNN